MNTIDFNAFFDRSTFYRDWDYFSSQVESLRIHLFQYHTIPTWNYMFCGGVPELANPQSWAYTWPSLFAYLGNGKTAILYLWICLSLVGYCSTCLLLRKLGSKWNFAIMGSGLYTVNGFFASHFNQGHATFAFFHLVPLLMVSTLYAWDCFSQKVYVRRAALGMLLTSFMFFTSGLPHALFYFFPATLIFLFLLFLLRNSSASKGERLKVFFLALVAQFLGGLLAAYKLWPIIAWQLKHPRRGVIAEEVELGDVLTHTLRFIPDYHEIIETHFENQIFGSWEYNAFLGPAVWIIIAWGAILWSRQQKNSNEKSSIKQLDLLGIAGLCFCLFGVVLAVGNKHPLGLAQFFKHLPLLSGIRVFSRYQINLVFGLCFLTVWASHYVAQSLSTLKLRLDKRIAFSLILLMLYVPPLWQTILLVSKIETLSSEKLDALYSDLPSVAVPQFAVQKSTLLGGATHQTYLMQKGYWIANCYEPLNVQRVLTGLMSKLPLTVPEPKRLIKIDRNQLVLEYSQQQSSWITSNFGARDNIETNQTMNLLANNTLAFHFDNLTQQTFSMRYESKIEEQGVLLSLLGILVSFGYIRWLSACKTSPHRDH